MLNTLTIKPKKRKTVKAMHVFLASTKISLVLLAFWAKSEDFSVFRLSSYFYRGIGYWKTLGWKLTSLKLRLWDGMWKIHHKA